jgi:hypothetical protein
LIIRVPFYDLKLGNQNSTNICNDWKIKYIIFKKIYMSANKIDYIQCHFIFSLNQNLFIRLYILCNKKKIKKDCNMDMYELEEDTL